MTAYDDLILADSPLFYWPLDETSGTTAADASGNGITGTYLGGPLFGEPGIRSCFDPADLAVYVDGEGVDAATAEMIHRTTSPISGTLDFTLEAWFWPDVDAFTRPGRRYMNLIQQRIGPPVVLGEPGMVRVFTNIEGALGTPTGLGLQLEDTPEIVVSLEELFARVGCWNHFAVTRSASLFTLYMNSTVVGTATSSLSVTNNNLSFGGDFPDRTRPDFEEAELFRGRIAKAAGYDHALTDVEIAERFASGCTQCGSGWKIGRIGPG